MNRGLHLGRVAGVEIVLDWSLLIIVFLVAFSLGAGSVPAWHPDWGPGLVWAVSIAAALLLMASVLLHELSHALVGRAQGIDIPRITLFVFGGMAQLEREPHGWRAEMWMAIVGPLASLAIGAACLVAAGWITGPIEIDPDDPFRALAGVGPLATILLWLGPVNIVLALFNLVPGFPLDGGRVLRAALWGLTGDLYRATRWASALGQAFAWVLIASGFAMILGARVPVFGSGPLGGMWIALIGWFLNNAAIASYRQLLARRVLEGVPVSRVMLSRFAAVEPRLPLARFVEDYALASDQRTFPVVDRDGRLAGLASVDDVRKVPASERPQRTVADVMTPARELATVEPGDETAAALQTLAGRAVDQVPVVKNGEVRGLLRREDIAKWLALHGESQAAAR